MGYIWIENGLYLNYQNEPSEIRPFLQTIQNGLKSNKKPPGQTRGLLRI